MILGYRLRELMKENNMSQENLGKLLGVTKVSVCGYENGTRIPSLDILNGIEIDIVTNRISMEEIHEQKEIRDVLWNRLHELSPKQADRIIKRYYENLSIVSIAKLENVDESSVMVSIYL